MEKQSKGDDDVTGIADSNLRGDRSGHGFFGSMASKQADAEDGFNVWDAMFPERLEQKPVTDEPEEVFVPPNNSI